ncbi:MAG TPA: pyridoxal phosphate-dependent aminotransferase [Deltaproteobacteria bacterium]|nr:aspartate aminotransferase [Deltaproteobacteria bacterium]HCP47572.1 pyridoxal phosphate-dependent aminotransferase [Deltaproteobacteria bacterium]|tara:strand:+ start:108 stop:1229 length:1122 start_codon:yes stop_codon:yes gene_type:complete
MAGLQGSLFSKLAHRIRAIEGEVHPLHVGDTWLEPLDGARMQDLRVTSHPGMHRYAQPHGHPALLDAIEQTRGTDRKRVLVTAGATGGLGALTGALLAPEDEVLILAPFWPLIRGIVLAARAHAVQVPFYDRVGVGAEGAEAVSAVLGAAMSDRTVAIYVNTPNNPTGRVVDGQVLAAVAEFARAHDLWLWSDEVYEPYAFAAPHVALADVAPERTFTAFSFSKAYGMAGNRCGYLVGPTEGEAMSEVRKVSTHTFYSAPTASQLAGAKALQEGDDWLAEARDLYRLAGNKAADALGVARPEGGTFLFLDVSEHLDDRGLQGFLEDCIDQGLVLAPGSSCGEAYGRFVRLCFTSAEPDVVARGVDKLCSILGR